MFDILFFNVFNHYKSSSPKKANKIAVVYTSLIQILLLIILGMIFRMFCMQMNIAAFNSETSWIVSILASIFIYFNNWMTYTGKKRIKIKSGIKNSKDYNIWLLWFLPIIFFLLIVLLWSKQ